MPILSAPQGDLTLERYPVRRNETLRAWDAADELVLTHLAAEPVDLGGTVMVVNDEWGALATALADHHPVVIGDSYVSHLATAANLAANGRSADAVQLRSTFEAPPDRIDVLIVRVPKAMALLEDELRRLTPSLHAGSIVIGAGMTKHVHTSTVERFESIVGPTTTTRAVKKARLILATPDPARAPEPSAWPTTFTLEPDGYVVSNEAGVFSGTRLDIGTNFFLAHLPERSGPERVVDLGCGNGVVGLVAAIDNPEAEITFVDESFAAVRSAEATFRANVGPDRSARFVADDGLASQPAGSVDLVLCNPPFHVNHAIGDATAWQMFTDAHRALRAGGELWVVGNRHLAYHAKLKRLFGHCDIVASNAKFVVFRSIRR